MIKTSPLFVPALLSLLSAGGAQAASFDCSKAGPPFERAICADKTLSDLDDQLARAWSDAQGRVSETSRAALVAEQRQWLKGRATYCPAGDGASARQCLATYYTQRITALSASRPSPVAAPTIPVTVETGRPQAQTQAQPEPKTKARLEEVRKRFTVNGQPISPGVVHDLSMWISDKQASVTTIDVLTAAGSNQYFSSDTKIINGWLGMEHKEESGGKTSFSYNFAGALNNGLVLVQTRSSEGGTSVFENLLILDVIYDRGLTPNDQPYDRVGLKVVREVALGDRVGAKIAIEGNTIYTVVGGARALLTEGRRP